MDLISNLMSNFYKKISNFQKKKKGKLIEILRDRDKGIAMVESELLQTLHLLLGDSKLPNKTIVMSLNILIDLLKFSKEVCLSIAETGLITSIMSQLQHPDVGKFSPIRFFCSNIQKKKKKYLWKLAFA